jgi:hypothetical protein
MGRENRTCKITCKESVFGVLALSDLHNSGCENRYLRSYFAFGVILISSALKSILS